MLTCRFLWKKHCNTSKAYAKELQNPERTWAMRIWTSVPIGSGFCHPGGMTFVLRSDSTSQCRVVQPSESIGTNLQGMHFSRDAPSCPLRFSSSSTCALLVLCGTDTSHSVMPGSGLALEAAARGTISLRSSARSCSLGHHGNEQFRWKLRPGAP